ERGERAVEEPPRRGAEPRMRQAVAEPDVGCVVRGGAHSGGVGHGGRVYPRGSSGRILGGCAGKRATARTSRIVGGTPPAAGAAPSAAGAGSPGSGAGRAPASRHA